MTRLIFFSLMIELKYGPDWTAHCILVLTAQALKDMDVHTLRQVLGNANLPSWINFPGEPAILTADSILYSWK